MNSIFRYIVFDFFDLSESGNFFTIGGYWLAMS